MLRGKASLCARVTSLKSYILGTPVAYLVLHMYLHTRVLILLCVTLNLSFAGTSLYLKCTHVRVHVYASLYVIVYVHVYTEDIFFPQIFFLTDLCFVVFSQTSLMDRGEIGKLPTFVNIPAAHRCNQGTSKRVMRVVKVIMVGGSRFFCLAPCLCLEQLQFVCCGGAGHTYRTVKSCRC